MPNSVLLAVLLSPTALAQEAPALTWSPLGVNVECQSQARVEVCTYLRGTINHSALLMAAPRSDDQVTVYVNVTERALEDVVNLRFVSALPGAPPVYAITQAIDSRATTDEQRLRLERAFNRGISVYLGQVNPEAVSVSLAAPETHTEVSADTTPWGFAAYGGGWGSRSENFQSADLWGGLNTSRATERSRLGGRLNANYSFSRQPSLEVDGDTIQLVASSYALDARFFVERHLNDAWSVGALARAGHQDPEGHFQHTTRAHAGISRDWFPSDDPRGNQLAVAYLAGVQADDYNQMNALAQETAVFATHMLLATGEVRFDTVELGLDLAAKAQLLAPLDRNVLFAWAWSNLNLGDHVDLSFNLGVTRRAIPGPLDIDASNYAAVTRTSYAEPLDLNGYLNLRVHWDPTNGVQNNRFDVVNTLGPLDNL